MITEVTEMIKHYPTVSLAVIAAAFSMIGWIGNNIFQVIIDRYKQQKELKNFLWKEKINAAKKASEFFLEYLGFINLLRNQFEAIEFGKDENDQVAADLNFDIQLLSNKLKEFPHFEYHHINIFYDFNESRAFEITNENFEILARIHGLKSFNLPKEEFDIQLKDCATKFKNNYAELAKIYGGFIARVRNDIANYL